MSAYAPAYRWARGTTVPLWVQRDDEKLDLQPYVPLRV